MINTRQNELFVYIMDHPNQSEGEIARGVGLKRTPYTRKLLFGLVEEGNVARAWDDSRQPGAFVYYIQQTDELPL